MLKVWGASWMEVFHEAAQLWRSTCPLSIVPFRNRAHGHDADLGHEALDSNEEEAADLESRDDEDDDNDHDGGDDAPQLQPQRREGAPAEGEDRPLSTAALQKLLTPLEGICLGVSRGYWTYEWCYRKHVRQYHMQPKNSDFTPPKGKKVHVVNGITYLQDPDWSLGVFSTRSESSDAERTRLQWPDVLKRDPGKKKMYLSNLHLGGQHCDETKKARTTEVRLMCCAGKSEGHASSKKKSKKNKKGQGEAAADAGATKQE